MTTKKDDEQMRSIIQSLGLGLSINDEERAFMKKYLNEQRSEDRWFIYYITLGVVVGGIILINLLS